jgi:hypothetical protein
MMCEVADARGGRHVRLKLELTSICRVESRHDNLPSRVTTDESRTAESSHVMGVTNAIGVHLTTPPLNPKHSAGLESERWLRCSRRSIVAKQNSGQPKTVGQERLMKGIVRGEECWILIMLGCQRCVPSIIFSEEDITRRTAWRIEEHCQ